VSVFGWMVDAVDVCYSRLLLAACYVLYTAMLILGQLRQWAILHLFCVVTCGSVVSLLTICARARRIDVTSMI
jgi:hypothetical protein